MNRPNPYEGEAQRRRDSTRRDAKALRCYKVSLSIEKLRVLCAFALTTFAPLPPLHLPIEEST